MNSPKEPEPGPDRRAQSYESGREAGRILRIDLPKREGTSEEWCGGVHRRLGNTSLER